MASTATTAGPRRVVQIPADLQGVLTVDVPTAAKHVGMSAPGYYVAAREGRVPALHIGRRVVVPVHLLLAFLGITADDLNAA